jgi:hypothetical protein
MKAGLAGTANLQDFAGSAYMENKAPLHLFTKWFLQNR